jgi:hypothetical protein
MTISLTCACGVRLEIDESFAGQTITCPDCQRSIVAPKPEPEGLRTSGFALTSLTLALVGAFTVIGTLLAVVFGLLGLQSVRRAPERVTGRGFALAGIGLGVALTALTLLGLIRGELFGLGGWYGAQRWAGKLDYDGPEEIVRPTEGFAIRRPSRKWGVYRNTTTKPGGVADPFGHVWDDLLLVNTEEDAHLLVISQGAGPGDMEFCRTQALDDFKRQDRGGFFGERGATRPVGRTVVVSTKFLAPIGTAARSELLIDKSMGGQDRRFLMRIVKENDDRGSAWVLIGGARKSHFERVRPELEKALDSFRIDNIARP